MSVSRSQQGHTKSGNQNFRHGNMILPTFTIQIGSVERKMSCEIQGTSRKYGKNAGRPYGLGEGGGDYIFSK